MWWFCSTCVLHVWLVLTYVSYYTCMILEHLSTVTNTLFVNCTWSIHFLHAEYNTTDATSGARTAYHSGVHEFNPVFSGVRVTRSLVLCVVLCRSFVVLLSFFCWSLRCLSIDLRILICKLVFVFCFHFMLVFTWLQCELFVLSDSNLTVNLCSLVDTYCRLK
jgi:hypothetical protein